MMSDKFINQMLNAEACWKEIAVRHIFADFSDEAGQELDAPTLFDECVRLSARDLQAKFEDPSWSWVLQDRYGDMSPKEAMDSVVNMVHLLDSNSSHLLRVQAAKLPSCQVRWPSAGNDLWSRNEIQFPRLLSEIVATQDLNIPAIAESMDLSVPDVNQLLDRAQVAWESHLRQMRKAGEDGTECAFNAWCRQEDGRGTTWVSQVKAQSSDEAIAVARKACASDWGWDDRQERILVVGIQLAISDAPIEWDDDGLQESQEMNSDGMAPFEGGM